MIKDLTYCDSVTHHCPSASVPDSAQLVSALSGTEVMCTSMYKVHTLLFYFSLTLPRPIKNGPICQCKTIAGCFSGDILNKEKLKAHKSRETVPVRTIICMYIHSYGVLKIYSIS